MKQGVRPRLFVELCCGSAAVTLRLLGGPNCKPPISYMGSKRGYAGAILAAMGLRSGLGADEVWLADSGPWGRVWGALADYETGMAVAAQIMAWKDEDPRALWDRLRAEGVPDGSDAAAWLFVQMRTIGGAPSGGFARETSADESSSTRRDVSDAEAAGVGAYIRQSREARGLSRAQVDLALGLNTACSWWEGRNFKGEFIVRPPSWSVWLRLKDVLGLDARFDDLLRPVPGDWTRKPPGAAELISAIGALPAFPSVKAMCVDVRTIAPPDDCRGVYLYVDPPYENTTGYANDLPRSDVLALARRWSDAGAVVCVSEAVPLPLDGWHHVEITSARVGQKRTFSKQQWEWLTMNRPPAHVPATQPDLFG